MALVEPANGAEAQSSSAVGRRLAGKTVAWNDFDRTAATRRFTLTAGRDRRNATEARPRTGA
jgi:hypothetical protein